jgi:type II secretory pathway pseudopilin PulG
MKKMNLKRGISLIVLVITIIVIIILAGAVILSLANNNPITQASEAAFKSNVDSYKSQLTLALTKRYAEIPSFNPDTFYARSWDGSVGDIIGSVKEHIPNITPTDGAKYVITQGKLQYIGNDTAEKQWAKNIGINDALALWIDALDFKNSPQTTTWLDKSGNGNNVTPYNFGYTSASGSDAAGSVVFDGVDDYMEVNNIFNINYDSSSTISVWVNPSTISKNFVIVGKNGYEYLLYQVNATFGFIHWNNIGSDAISIKTDNCITVGQLTNVVYKYDGTTKRGSLYVNGVLKVSAISAYDNLKQTTETLKIGTGYSWGQFTQKFSGKISNISFYNRALTDAEILYKYNAGK